MKKKLIFYLNGKFVPEEETKVSIMDLGFLRGYGVFDFLRTYHGKPFKLDEHLKRLKNSASQISLKFSWTTEQLKDLVLQTLAKNHLPEANIKIIVSGGVSSNQILPDGEPTLAILVYKPPVYPKSFYEKGIKVITVPASRVLPKVKTTNYLSAVMALIKARKKGALEALYVNEKGEVLEATTSNFFVFKDNILIAPKEGILSGITREVVLELTKGKFEVQPRPIKYQELKIVDEAFLTATNKEVMPVVKIDKMMVGNGKVGGNTKCLIKLFREYTQGVYLFNSGG